MNGLLDLIDLTPSDPVEYYTCNGEGWYTNPVGTLIRKKNTLVFYCYLPDTEEPELGELVREADEFYHWRDADGYGHWRFFLTETSGHTYLIGNWKNPSGDQGFCVFVWPKEGAEPGAEAASKKAARRR